VRNSRLIKIKLGVIATLIVLTLAQITATAQSGARKRTLEGVWEVTITPRNCVTGDPIPTAASRALYTFHADGTMTAWTQNATIVVTRSPSLGLWRSDHGWSDYSFKFVHLRYNPAGAFIGKQEGRGTLILGDSGDDFTVDGSATVFDINDVPGAPGCSNSVGTRFKLDS